MKKRFIFPAATVAMVMAVCVAFTGCGEKMPYEGLNFDDYIKVGKYKGLSVEEYSTEVTEDDVQQKIDEALNAAGTETEVKKGDAIKKGDTANIDYEGKLNGKAFEGGTAQGFDLEIGSGTFIEGFEDGLIGKKVGDEVSLDLTFPENYNNEELAGKDVVFDVKINSAKRKSVPKYDDAFVKKNTTYANTKEYEASLKESIAEEKKTSGINTQKGELWSQVMENTEMLKYPEDQVKKYQESYDAQLDEMAKQNNIDKKQLMEQYGASDEASLNQMLKESAETLVKQEMTIEYIADKEELEYTKDEMKKRIEELEGQGYDEESVLKQTGRTMEEYVHINLLYEKVVDFILEKAKITKAKK